MDLHSLRVFLALSSSLHFGRASRACNLSPSAVSRTLTRLEAEVGEKLFIRDNRTVQLTAAGDRLRRWARASLESWEQLRGSLANDRGSLSGEIVLYCSVAASYTVLSSLFKPFREAYPGVHIRLQTGDPADSVGRVQSGHADIVVAARPDSLPRNLVFKAVVMTPLEFISPASPCEAASLVKGLDVPWSRVPMVLSETGLSRARVDAWFRAKGIHPNIYAEVSGHEAIVSMVRLGCGVGVVPRLVLERFAQKGEVRVIDAPPALEPYVVGLCTHKRSLASPLVKAFWSVVP